MINPPLHAHTRIINEQYIMCLMKCELVLFILILVTNLAEK